MSPPKFLIAEVLDRQGREVAADLPSGMFGDVIQSSGSERSFTIAIEQQE